MTPSRRRLSCLLLPSLLAGACAHTESLGPLHAEPLYADSHCGREESRAAAWWITDEDGYHALRARLHRPGAGTAPPPVDFRSYAALLIEMGRQPSAGYAIELARPEIEEGEFGAVTLHVRWRTPERGTMSAQVITSPCLLVKLPRSDFREIRIVDQMGRERVVATRSAKLPELPRGGVKPPRW